MKLTLLAKALIAFSAFAATTVANASEVLVRGGTYEPFFREKGETSVRIEDLVVDVDPVTNGDFLKFVKRNPEWKRSRIPKVFAGEGYLKHWKSDSSIDPSIRRRPVIQVSWFAARAYCESQGKRLLTVNEWEYVSDAQNPKHLEEILEWYAKSANQLTTVDKSTVNRFGLRGIHGLIWEWTEDFSGVIIAGDSRDSNDTKANAFCGAGSLSSKDPAQYATFMRFAHRSSLSADYVGGSLGFRCARTGK